MLSRIILIAYRYVQFTSMPVSWKSQPQSKLFLKPSVTCPVPCNLVNWYYTLVKATGLQISKLDH